MGHGGNILKAAREKGIDPFHIHDFSANISPLGFPEGLRQILNDTVRKLSIYPDPEYHELRKAMATYSVTDKERIIPGNGAAQIIHDAIRFINPGKTMLPVPTFSEYEAALRTTNSQITYFYNNPEQAFSLNETQLLHSMDESFDLLVLCNPNNPTGALLSREAIFRILNHCHKIGCQVMIDEAFMDFVEREEHYSMVPFIAEWKNLIIVRAFTKVFAIPGIRLGYGVYGSLEKAKIHADQMIPWSINTYAEAMKDFINTREAKDYLEEVREIIAYERKRLYQEIKQMENYHVFPSAVNFLLIQIKKTDKMTVKGLWNQLMEDGILIRDCSNFKGMPDDFFRIAVKNKEENQRFIDSLKKAHETILCDKRC